MLCYNSTKVSSSAWVMIRNLKYLKNFSDEALSTLVDFWNNCDCAPDVCNVTQTLREDGKIDLAITWE